MADETGWDTIRTVSTHDDFTDEVPVALQAELSRFLDGRPIVVQRVKAKSGWAAGCALCQSTLWAVKIKGRHGLSFHAQNLASHREYSCQQVPNVQVSS